MFLQEENTFGKNLEKIAENKFNANSTWQIKSDWSDQMQC